MNRVVTAGTKRAVHAALLQEPPASDDTAGLRARLTVLVGRLEPLWAASAVDALVEELLDEVLGLGPLEALLADPAVTDILVNGPDAAFVERDGRLEAVALGLDAAAIARVAERIVAPLGLRLDRASPLVDARLADGSRVHAVLPPLAPDGPCLSIRRFARRSADLRHFGATGDAGAFLADAVAHGANVVVAGGTGAGKTTLLNALGAAVPAHERVITIEETAELRLGHPHVVRLEARPANSEGAGAVSVRDLVRAALRMRPDRIVVGEVRAGEALDMLQACNTGHDGSLSTLHANGVEEALLRLETLALFANAGLPLSAIRRQIGTAIDLVVFVARRGAQRRIEQIAEVDPAPYDHGVGVTVCFGLDHHGELVRRQPPRFEPRRSASLEGSS